MAIGVIPELEIFGYAFDDTGALIQSGATVVPEPGPMALMALGALALGAKGLRTWRRNRVAGTSLIWSKNAALSKTAQVAVKMVFLLFGFPLGIQTVRTWLDRFPGLGIVVA